MVHRINTDGSVRSDGVEPFELASQMVDWPCDKGACSLRLLHVDAQRRIKGARKSGIWQAISRYWSAMRAIIISNTVS